MVKRAPSLGFAFCAHPSTMTIGDLFHDRKADAPARPILAYDLHQHARNARKRSSPLHREADAGILHNDRAHELALRDRHANRAPFRGVAHGVRDEVRGGLAQHIGIAIDVYVWIVVVGEFETRFFHIGLMGGDHCVDHLDQVDLREFDRIRAVLQTRELQERIDQTAQTPHFGIECLKTLFIGDEHAIDHGFDRGLDSHERRAELVRNVGDQATFHIAVRLDRIGHLVEGLAQTSDLIIAHHVSTR